MSRALPIPVRAAPAAPAGSPAVVLGGRFRLDERLPDAARSSGEAWRAWDEWLGRRVLVRLLSPELARHPRVAAVLRAHARTAAGTRHPNLVERLEVALGPGRPRVVTELVEGERLDVRLARCGPLDVREVAAVVTGVAAGLTALHGAGAVHGDVSPATIVLGADGRTRLGDPDAIRVAGIPTGNAPDGTRLDPAWRFAAPEILAGAPPTQTADTYALAAVAYAALVGRPPVVTPALTTPGRAPEPPIRASLLRAGLDPAVDRLLVVALGAEAGRPAPYAFAVGLVAALRASDSAGIAPDGIGDRARGGARRGSGGRLGRARGALVTLLAGGVVLLTAAAGLAALDGAIASVRGRPAPAVDGSPAMDLVAITGPAPAPPAEPADAAVAPAPKRMGTPARAKSRSTTGTGRAATVRTPSRAPSRASAGRVATGGTGSRLAGTPRRRASADEREHEAAESD